MLESSNLLSIWNSIIVSDAETHGNYDVIHYSNDGNRTRELTIRDVAYAALNYSVNHRRNKIQLDLYLL
jgi:hypothetical protein